MPSNSFNTYILGSCLPRLYRWIAANLASSIILLWRLSATHYFVVARSWRFIAVPSFRVVLSHSNQTVFIFIVGFNYADFCHWMVRLDTHTPKPNISGANWHYVQIIGIGIFKASRHSRLFTVATLLLRIPNPHQRIKVVLTAYTRILFYPWYDWFLSLVMTSPFINFATSGWKLTNPFAIQSSGLLRVNPLKGLVHLTGRLSLPCVRLPH